MRIEVWTVVMMLSHRCLSKAVVCKMITVICKRNTTAVLNMVAGRILLGFGVISRTP